MEQTGEPFSRELDQFYGRCSFLSCAVAVVSEERLKGSEEGGGGDLVSAVATAGRERKEDKDDSQDWD